MPVKEYLKRGLTFILKGTPVKHITANVTTLAPNELLQRRVALITGGTSGIGYEIAKAFLNAGASVIITGRNYERVGNAVESLRKESCNGGGVSGVEMDMRNATELKARFAEAEKMAGSPIDILVNNAGVLGCNFSDGSETDYDAILDTNLKGVFFLSQLVAHYMKDRHIKGNILNVASSSSLRPASSAYTVSKWGLRGLTLGMAKLLAPYDIVVNGIAPGPTATPMLMPGGVKEDISFKTNPTGRYALPEEIANMAVILVSNMGRMVVGDIVYMTGGAGLLTFDDINYQF